jgi:hypothetical protein
MLILLDMAWYKIWFAQIFWTLVSFKQRMQDGNKYGSTRTSQKCVFKI